MLDFRRSPATVTHPSARDCLSLQTEGAAAGASQHRRGSPRRSGQRAQRRQHHPDVPLVVRKRHHKPPRSTAAPLNPCGCCPRCRGMGGNARATAVDDQKRWARSCPATRRKRGPGGPLQRAHHSRDRLREAQRGRAASSFAALLQRRKRLGLCIICDPQHSKAFGSHVKFGSCAPGAYLCSGGAPGERRASVPRAAAVGLRWV